MNCHKVIKLSALPLKVNADVQFCKVCNFNSVTNDSIETVINCYPSSQIVLSVAIACASAQIRPFVPAPAVYNRNNFEKDAVILKQVFDLNPVDNSYVSRWVNRLFKVAVYSLFGFATLNLTDILSSQLRNFKRNQGR